MPDNHSSSLVSKAVEFTFQSAGLEAETDSLRKTEQKLRSTRLKHSQDKDQAVHMTEIIFRQQLDETAHEQGDYWQIQIAHLRSHSADAQSENGILKEGNHWLGQSVRDQKNLTETKTDIWNRNWLKPDPYQQIFTANLSNSRKKVFDLEMIYAS
jgi:hypothetical protein